MCGPSQEFRKSLAALKLTGTNEEFDEIFAVLDKDGSGRIDTEELKRAFSGFQLAVNQELADREEGKRRLVEMRQLVREKQQSVRTAIEADKEDVLRAEERAVAEAETRAREREEARAVARGAKGGTRGQ